MWRVDHGLLKKRGKTLDQSTTATKHLKRPRIQKSGLCTAVMVHSTLSGTKGAQAHRPRGPSRVQGLRTHVAHALSESQLLSDS